MLKMTVRIVEVDNDGAVGDPVVIRSTREFHVDARDLENFLRGETKDGDVAWSIEVEGYDGHVCACTSRCERPCKGLCGCRACRTGYGDDLSSRND